LKGNESGLGKRERKLLDPNVQVYYTPTAVINGPIMTKIAKSVGKALNGQPNLGYLDGCTSHWTPDVKAAFHSPTVQSTTAGIHSGMTQYVQLVDQDYASVFKVNHTKVMNLLKVKYPNHKHSAQQKRIIFVKACWLAHSATLRAIDLKDSMRKLGMVWVLLQSVAS